MKLLFFLFVLFREVSCNINNCLCFVNSDRRPKVGKFVVLHFRLSEKLDFYVEWGSYRKHERAVILKSGSPPNPSQIPLKPLKNEAQITQEAFKRPKRRPRDGQERPRDAQEAPKRHPRGAQEHPRAPDSDPREPKMRPRATQPLPK